MLELLHPFKGDMKGQAEAVRFAQLRRKERECDRALTGTARRWLRQLPARRRPLRLCVAHPRVANRIAWFWPDPALSTQLLEDLLHDSRGGRRGFSPAIARELQRLRDFNAAQRTEVRPESLWEALARVLGAA